MPCYYDQFNKRLVSIKNEASSNYWDEHWNSGDFESILKNSRNVFITDNTRKYLKPGSRILEGGCGRGDKVYSLQASGFDAYGVDFAQDTVGRINKLAPELKVSLGDVRKLDFQNDFFDGYWSLGVIEHFYNGYADIAKEMRRVLRNEGYLFLTVPSMSLLRKLKARLGLYPEYKYSQEREKNFYQFLLPTSQIIKSFEEIGFSLLSISPLDGAKGMKDEIPFCRPLLRWMYNNNTLIAKVLRRIFNILMSKFSNHIMFYIFQKK